MTESALMKSFRSEVLDLGGKRTVLKIPYADLDGAWIIQSFGKDKQLSSLLNDSDIHVHGLMTFLFDNGEGVAAEWEPQHGPIQVWYRCVEDWKGDDGCGHEISAKKHWFFDWVENCPLAWSQLAVDRELLKQKDIYYHYCLKARARGILTDEELLLHAQYVLRERERLGVTRIL